MHLPFKVSQVGKIILPSHKKKICALLIYQEQDTGVMKRAAVKRHIKY